MASQTFKVSGMTCSHCVQAVSGELHKLDGVTGVDIDLPSGLVSVTSDRDIAPEAFEAAVDEAGYEVAS